jgi:hypothetical protein
MLSQAIWGITLAACVGAPADKGSIERLLEPASQQEAFLDYLVDSSGDIYTRAELEERNHLISFQKCTKRKLFGKAYFQLVFRDDLSLYSGLSLDPGFPIEGIERFFKSHPSEILPLDDFEEVFFDSQGKKVRLFANRSAERLIAHDLNGDGEVERLSRKTRKPSIFGGDEGFSLQQLLITSISKNPKTLLHVVFNAYPESGENTNAWGFSVVDRDGDKSYEIEFGPELKKGIEPQVVYTWNAKEKKYTGPDGGTGEHFVRIHNEEQRDGLERAGLGYRQKPNEVEDNSSDLANGAKSYRPLDVNGVTDEQILTYMG